MPFNSTRKITYRRTDACGHEIPAIILEGEYLKQFNFCLGDHVSVNYQPGRIEILSLKGGGKDAN